ncbi:sugar ABC transporter permease [Micrococcales bacterium 31B]|nr:sugar ABC transporter permease [Micrococcales bacterium 31B]
MTTLDHRRPTTVKDPDALRIPPRRGNRLTHRPLTGFLLVLPAFVLVLVFVLAPLVGALGISLTNFPLIGEFRWVGLANYAAAFQDPKFGAAIGYTLLYTAIVTVPILVVGYALAVLVRSQRRGVGWLRTITFVPYVVGLSTLSFLTVLEVQPDVGALNLLLKALRVTDGSTAWLVDGRLATGLICALVIWSCTGLTMILLMSGMQSVPAEVHESAQIDGAGWWRREVSLTIPMMKRSIILSVILSIVGSLLAFAQFYILTAGGPGNATTTSVLYIYNRAFVQLQLGSATALSILYVLVIGVITALQFALTREKD